MKRSHWLLMLLCCLIPLVGIAAIVVFRIPASSVLYVALVLACPLMHLVMMRSMGQDHANPSRHAGHHLSATQAEDALASGAPRGRPLPEKR